MVGRSHRGIRYNFSARGRAAKGRTKPSQIRCSRRTAITFISPSKQRGRRPCARLIPARAITYHRKDGRRAQSADRQADVAARAARRAQLPTRHGLVGTHRLRIIRIEQSAILPDPLTLSHSPLPEPVPVSAPLAAAPPRSLPPPQPALEGWLDGQRALEKCRRNDDR